MGYIFCSFGRTCILWRKYSRYCNFLFLILDYEINISHLYILLRFGYLRNYNFNGNEYEDVPTGTYIKTLAWTLRGITMCTDDVHCKHMFRRIQHCCIWRYATVSLRILDTPKIRDPIRTNNIFIYWNFRYRANYLLATINLVLIQNSPNNLWTVRNTLFSPYKHQSPVLCDLIEKTRQNDIRGTSNRKHKKALKHFLHLYRA